jgi:ribonuclease HII
MPFLVCGLDEVGRGALAGPLIAVASLFYSPAAPIDIQQGYRWWEMDWTPIKGVDDSKKLTPKKRREVFQRILRSGELADFGIGEVSVEEINSFGIDWANSVAFERAVKDLSQAPHHILIDGDNPLIGWSMLDQIHEPRADGRWWPVGAASILAKVIRDSYMAELAKDFDIYGWEQNSGYGSDKHRSALIDFGPCKHHRVKFIRNIIRSSP